MSSKNPKKTVPRASVVKARNLPPIPSQAQNHSARPIRSLPHSRSPNQTRLRSRIKMEATAIAVAAMKEVAVRVIEVEGTAKNKFLIVE